MSTTKRKALGKGLNALLSDASTDITSKKPVPLNNVTEIPINEIEANPFQPREDFTEGELEELVDSIKIHGIIQPVTLRKVGYGKYQLISGERRTRAAIRAGLEKIPAYVRVANDQSMLEMALIENIHREDLNPIEIAISYKRLIEECKLVQEDVAKRIGKNRTTVTNYLRLLKLPNEIQLALRKNKISMGHARAIINIENPEKQLELLLKTIEENLSVREIESMAKDAKPSRNSISKTARNKEVAKKDYSAFEEKFSDIYQMPVKIKPKRGKKGELVIPFNSEEDLHKILGILEK
jgi:ParB family chromosome partitioning protein